MKIYILRHEDRTQDCSLFSPLTEGGLENAIKLVDILEKIKIDLVFSSPFIRTLQTIYPYVNKNNKTINLEYGLSELNHQDIIPKKSVGIYLPEYIAKSFLYNLEYKTLIEPNNIKYPETPGDCVKRTKQILKKIIEKYYKEDINILLVTHQSLCVNILNIVNRSKLNNNEIEKEELNEYKMGKCCLVYDNGWKYKKIN